MKKYCIVIPVYHLHPTNTEIISFQSLAKNCDKTVDVYIVHPNNFNNDNIKSYEDIFIKDGCNNINDISFNKKYFESMTTYSDLMKSYDFYNRFKDYKYILIFQGDCWAMPNMGKNIIQWLNADYDYVGAPIIGNTIHWTVPACGNGGLSLRKVSKFLEITKRDDIKTKLESEDNKYKKYEDVYFCEGVTKYIYMDMPTWDECAIFSWDMNPDVLDYKGFSHPMIGIHGWLKNIPYWENILDIPDNIIKEAYETEKSFIQAYYHQNV